MRPRTTTTSGRRRAAALALGALATLGALGAPARAQEGGDAQLKAEYDEVIGKEAQMLQELQQAQQARRAAGDKLHRLEADTRAKQLELLRASADLDQAEAALELRIIARRQALQQVHTTRDRLRAQIAAAYVTGGDHGGQIEAFLAAGTTEEIGQAITYGRAVSSTTQRLVDQLVVVEAKATEAARAANRARTRAQDSRDTIAQAASFLLSARAQQQSLVRDLDLKFLVEAQALREVQGRKAVVEGRINAMNTASDGVAMILNQRQADQPDWVPGVVETSSPIAGVEVSSPYGPRFHPILHITRLHAGCDLGSPTGTEIHAAADGVVVLAEVRGGYGNAVVIDHGNSLATLYGHTSKMLVKAGDRVYRGEVIALVGSTGLSTGPHLHFETRVKGLPIDPEGVVDFQAPVDYEALAKAAAKAGFTP